MSELQHSMSPLDGLRQRRPRTNDMAIAEILMERRTAIKSGKLKGRQLFASAEESSSLMDVGRREEISCHGLDDWRREWELKSVYSYDSDDEKGNTDSTSKGSASSSLVCDHECKERLAMAEEETKVVVASMKEEKKRLAGVDEYRRTCMAVVIGWLAIGLIMSAVVKKSFGGYGNGQELTLADLVDCELKVVIGTFLFPPETDIQTLQSFLGGKIDVSMNRMSIHEIETVHCNSSLPVLVSDVSIEEDTRVLKKENEPMQLAVVNDASCWFWDENRMMRSQCEKEMVKCESSIPASSNIEVSGLSPTSSPPTVKENASDSDFHDRLSVFWKKNGVSPHESSGYIADRVKYDSSIPASSKIGIWSTEKENASDSDFLDRFFVLWNSASPHESSGSIADRVKCDSSIPASSKIGLWPFSTEFSAEKENVSVPVAPDRTNRQRSMKDHEFFSARSFDFDIVFGS